jgi:transcriptional regulator with XRE-family HTH domain
VGCQAEPVRAPSPFEPPTAPGALVRRAREQAGLSQLDLARRAEIRPSTLSRLESGARSPQWPMVERVLAALGLQPTLGVETLDAHLGRQLDDELSRPPLEWFDDLSVDAPAMVRIALDAEVVIDGPAAARMHGLPLPVSGDLHFTALGTDAAVESLVRACERHYISLHPGDDDQELFAMRPGRLLLFRLVERLPAWTAILPPSTETYPSPEPGRTIRVAQPSVVRLDHDHYRLLQLALARRRDHAEEAARDAS